MYQGNQKPKSATEFLDQFVTQAADLEKSGILHQSGCSHAFRISAFVCDMPARSFIKCVKGHGAYSGCDRCEQHGLYINKVTYPDCNATLRTDESFRQMSDSIHHILPTPLTQLSIDMVYNFPLDYMHLVCLGVMRKLVCLWFAGPLTTRLGPLAKKELDNKLQSFKQYLPIEFARKSRALSEFERWKATEYRTFLVYTGPVCLKDSLEDELYQNFMLAVFSSNNFVESCVVSPVC
jgi:hypothetical protein